MRTQSFFSVTSVFLSGFISYNYLWLIAYMPHALAEKLQTGVLFPLYIPDGHPVYGLWPL